MFSKKQEATVARIAESTASQQLNASPAVFDILRKRVEIEITSFTFWDHVTSSVT